MANKLILSKSAQKQYKRLPQTEQKKISKKLFSLLRNPLSGKKLEGELIIYRSLRAWPYRIIYLFDEENNQVKITSILHRQGAYKD